MSRFSREKWRRLPGGRRICVAGPEGEGVLAVILAAPDEAPAAADQLPGRGGRCSAYRFEHQGRNYFAKSFPALSVGERLKNLWRGSRALCSWRLSRQFAARGVPVPRPVAILQEGKWWPGRSLLVTDFVDKARTLRQAWSEAGPPERADLLERTAALLGGMHASGALHGDTHWDNILVGPEEEGAPLWLIDYDGGQVSARLSPAELTRDLAHFLRDLFAGSARFVEDRNRFLQLWRDSFPADAGARSIAPESFRVSLSSKRKTRMIDRIQAQFEEHVKVARQAATQLAPSIVGAVEMLAGALQAGNKVLVFGNGGSAADAQHLAAELVGRFLMERKALPAIALTTDTSILTAVGNDYGFEQVFARQVEALARPGDVVFGITTSGNSENVLRALTTAQAIGCRTIGLLGNDGGRAAGFVDIALVVPSKETPRIQEAHAIVIHVICDNLEKVLFGKQA